MQPWLVLRPGRRLCASSARTAAGRPSAEEAHGRGPWLFRAMRAGRPAADTAASPRCHAAMYVIRHAPCIAHPAHALSGVCAVGPACGVVAFQVWLRTLAAG